MAASAAAGAHADARRGAAYGLLAAALFGASAPVAKLLLPAIDPLLFAALLYLGAGAALSLVRAARRSAEAPLRRADLPLLAGVIGLGGMLGPVLLLVGLARLTAVTGALLLNLEAVFTILVAVVVFGEHLGGRAGAATLLVVGGAAILGLAPAGLRADGPGVACVAGACLAWGIDNNLTQRLSLRDPVAVVRLKTLAAGTGNLALALASGHARWPGGGPLAAALALGALSYGASVVLDAYALRLLGAAREAAYFATAPFVGAALAVPITGRFPGVADGAAALFMIAGVALLLRERHGHAHTHEALEHEHVHVHDEHHRHAHDGPVAEPHSHAHRHEPITHDHPHVPDLHHRHRHG